MRSLKFFFLSLFTLSPLLVAIPATAKPDVPLVPPPLCLPRIPVFSFYPPETIPYIGLGIEPLQAKAEIAFQYAITEQYERAIEVADNINNNGLKAVSLTRIAKQLIEKK